MPVKRICVGSGITRRQQITIKEPFGQEEIAAIKQLIDKDYSFEGAIARPAETVARRILKAVGVTSDFVVEPDGREIAGWTLIVTMRGFTIDSEEGYAAQVLATIRLLRASLKHHNVEGFGRSAFELGVLVTEARLKFSWEKDALAGRKSHEGARRGHEIVHGSQAQKRARWAAMRRDYLGLLMQHRRKKTATFMIAEQYNCSEKTVRRAVKRRP